MAHTSADVARRIVEAVAKRDFETAINSLTDDATYHVSGHGPIAGEYRGKQKVMELAKKQMELTHETQEVIEIHDVIGGDDHAVAMMRLRARRDDKVFDWGRVVVFHVDGDKVTEAWIIDGDQQGLDRFLS